jgi:hypothetical protein
LKKQIFCVFKSQFLKTQFPNDLCSAIWFKISLIVYEIAIPNTPLMRGKPGYKLALLFFVLPCRCQWKYIENLISFNLNVNHNIELSFFFFHLTHESSKIVILSVKEFGILRTLTSKVLFGLQKRFIERMTIFLKKAFLCLVGVYSLEYLF